MQANSLVVNIVFQLNIRTKPKLDNFASQIYTLEMVDYLEFSGIQIVVGYLMPNPIYIYINMICKQIACR